MWPEDYWPDSYWSGSYWAKEGGEPPVGGGGGSDLGLGQKRTFSTSSDAILGGGGSL